MPERRISYALEPCALGWLGVAGTSRGVCAVMFGDGPEELVAALRREFPWAALSEDPARLRPWTGALLDLAAGRAPRCEVPLDVRGSRFQQRVWQAIRAIPHGETRAYGELAQQLGSAAGARAVARACAGNPVALAVPCHRVIPADGGTGGYRWGPLRKRALLAAEQREAGLSREPGGLPCAGGPHGPRSAA